MIRSAAFAGLLATAIACCTPGTVDAVTVTPGEAAASSPTMSTLPDPNRAADGSFPARLHWDGVELQRNGSGLCEWGLLGIDLYLAALYCERRVVDLASALVPDQRTIVHLHFVRSLTTAQLRQAFTAAVQHNAGDRATASAAPLQRLLATMQDVRAGDSYTFGGAPGRGLTIARNGRAVDTIDDEPFRRLFLELYLGDHPPTPALRRALLGGA
jgi:hypothetical protein